MHGVAQRQWLPGGPTPRQWQLPEVLPPDKSSRGTSKGAAEKGQMKAKHGIPVTHSGSGGGKAEQRQAAAVQPCAGEGNAARLAPSFCPCLSHGGCQEGIFGWWCLRRRQRPRRDAATAHVPIARPSHHQGRPSGSSPAAAFLGPPILPTMGPASSCDHHQGKQTTEALEPLRASGPPQCHKGAHSWHNMPVVSRKWGQRQVTGVSYVP